MLPCSYSLPALYLRYNMFQVGIAINSMNPFVSGVSPDMHDVLKAAVHSPLCNQKCATC